jgi:folate-dependent tRNA-U54 methylase TrmFO/GidA
MVGFQTNLKFGEQKKSIPNDSWARKCWIHQVWSYA